MKNLRLWTYKTLTAGLLALPVSLSSCQTAPVKASDYQAGQWSIKAVVENLRNKERVVLETYVIAEKNRRFKMEVNSFEGVGLGELVVNGSETYLLLTQSHQYYRGKSRPRAMNQFLPAHFKYEWLYSILFDAPIEGWTCENDNKGFIESCRDLVHQSFLRWKNREGARKQVEVAHPDFQLHLSFQSFSGKDTLSDEDFKFQPPLSYRQLRN